MKSKRVFTALLAALILSLLAFSSGLAKGLTRVMIIGPGIEEEIEITDPIGLMPFKKIRFAPFVDGPPPGLLATYFEIRMGADHPGTDIYHFYPSVGGSNGYFYYANVTGGWSSARGKWFRLIDESDQLLREFLITLGAPRNLLTSWGRMIN